MAAKLHWISGLSVALCLLSAPSHGQAQTERSWVDPPSDAGAPAPSPAMEQPKPASPTSGPSTDVQADQVSREKTPQRAAKTAAPAPSKPVVKSTSQNAVAERKVRKPTREATIRTERQKQAAPRRELSEQTPRSARADRIREGVASGLELMTLRTIEYPDGRRVQILTRPRPGDMSELGGPLE